MESNSGSGFALELTPHRGPLQGKVKGYEFATWKVGDDLDACRSPRL